MATVEQPTLLLTRPEADSRRFAALLPDWPALIAPILRIVQVPHDVERLRAARGLVFTSANAIPAAGPGRGRLAICVGSRTGEMARQAGFTVQEGNGFAESLLPLIASAGDALIHPHGRHLARELPVPGMIVYDQLSLKLNDLAQDLLAGSGPVVVPLFSPRSARILSEQTLQARAPLWLVAISRAAMECWTGPAIRRIIAPEPSVSSMAASIRQLPLMEH